jgi:uncharacterized protein
MGISHAAIVPSVGLFFGEVGDPAVRTELCRAYNTWMRDWCSLDRVRLIPVATMPQWSPTAMIDAARHAADELGIRALVLRPTFPGGMGMSHPGLQPFWAFVADAGMAILIHDATTGDPLGGNYLFRHALGHPVAMQRTFMELALGGVFDAFPTLRVAFCEAGSGWLPYWLERLDVHLAYWGHASRSVELTPIDYFRRNCFVTPISNERTLPWVADLVGAGRIAFSSDYPLPYDGEAGAAGLWARTDLDAATKRAVLNEAGAALLGLAA